MMFRGKGMKKHAKTVSRLKAKKTGGTAAKPKRATRKVGARKTKASGGGTGLRGALRKARASGGLKGSAAQKRARAAVAGRKKRMARKRNK